MTSDIWPAILLVLVTAVATGAVSLAVSWQQSRIAERRRLAERKEALEDERATHSREHALALHAALEELFEIGRTAQRNDEGLPDEGSLRPYVSAARKNYLLIADPQLRLVVADGLTIVASGRARNVDPKDWREAAATTAFVVAAFLRGEKLPAQYVNLLADLRSVTLCRSSPARYTPGDIDLR